MENIDKILRNYMKYGVKAKGIGVLFFDEIPIQMNQESLEKLIIKHNLPFKIQRGCSSNPNMNRLTAKYKNFNLVAVEVEK